MKVKKDYKYEQKNVKLYENGVYVLTLSIWEYLKLDEVKNG